MSRLVLIAVLSGIITYSIISMNQNQSVSFANENAIKYFSQLKARDISNSTIHMLMSYVADDFDWRMNTLEGRKILDGRAEYTVIDEIFDGEELIKFSVSGEYFGTTKQIVVYAKPMDPLPIGVEALAAITTNNDILTLGNITVDGRDHKIDGTLIPGEGTYGVWTTNTYTQGGASKVGGTYEEFDYTPSKNPDPNI
ncbi:MAG: hypothetical protein ACW99Q_27875, partial [Candidatus Kariarchaeaceae archaeon]